jgi:phosphate transport system substrate-binding protein
MCYNYGDSKISRIEGLFMEKENKKTLGLILIIILIVVSCIGLFFVLINLNKEEKVSDEIIFSKENLPRVDASLATQPLVDAFMLNFTGKTTEELNIEYTNTHPGYVKLVNNETDLIVVTSPSEEELELAKEKGIELDVTKVVNEGFVFFVNKENEIDNVTLEQIQKIYTGEITNWKELGGPDREIIAYQRPVNSGSQTGLINLVMKGLQIKIPTVKESVELTMAGIVDYVADYENGIDAIGYSYYYYANEMYWNDGLKYLGINGVKPNYQTIQNETYPILTAYYIVTRKGETNENVLKLKEAMLSKRGQVVAREAGYVPIK